MAAGGVLVGRGYVSIRPEFEGDWSRSVTARASAAGRSGAGAFSKAFGVGLKGLGALAGVAVGANLSSAAAGAAILAPALTTAGVAAGALKLGLSGVSEAFKAAFADSSAQASAAASATKAVESAQRGLANAQRALAQTRVDAARRVADAQREVVDAERELSDAQQDARQVQGELTDARRDATRALEDMNQQLAESHLDEREAVLRLKEAEQELRAAQKKPGVTPQELEELQIRYERAKLNLQEQQRETKRLATDTKAANKAGVEGSEQVLAVKERISEANETVADKERALADAQRGVSEARAEGAQQIEAAQRAVADAAAAVADAQAAAAAQTSKFDEAMAKLAPNAQSFVRAVQGLAPAWADMRMSVQNELFKGLDDTVTQLGRTTIPILKRGLTETAGVWNAMAKNAAGAVTEMARTGLLDQIIQGANANLAEFAKTPGQLITAFGQLSVAAQPAFNALSQQMAGAITSFTDGIAESFASGGLEQGITSAIEILSQFGTLLGNVLGVVQQIFKAASDAGGEIVGSLGAVFGELRKVLATDEMQASMRALFGSVAQIVGAIVPVIGAVVQAAVPLMAAIAEPIALIATAVGPLLQQLATVLGAALLPIVDALAPALVLVGETLVQMVAAVMPLLLPIAQLISSVITALAPALQPIVAVATQLINLLVGPLTLVIQALTPALVQIAGIVAGVFQALQPMLQPLLGLLAQVAQLLAEVFAAALAQLMPILTPLVDAGLKLIETVFKALEPLLPVIGQALEMLGDALLTILPSFSGVADAAIALVEGLAPLIPVGVQLITTVLDALLPILPTVAEAFVAISEALLAIAQPLAEMVGAIAKQLAPILADIAPILGEFVALLADTLARILPPLAEALLALVEAFTPLLPVIAELVGMVLEMAGGILIELLPSLLQLAQAGVDLVVALLPLVPPLAELVALALELAINVLDWLLPPLLDLAGFLISGFASALSTAIGWISGMVKAIAGLVTWVTKHLGPAFRWLNDKVVQPVWRAISAAVKFAWEKVIRPTFGYFKDGLRALGDVLRWLRDNVVRPVWDAVGSKISAVWRDGIKPAFDALKRAIGKVADAFGTAKDAIGKAWDKIRKATKDPINFVLNTVWNKGVVKAWDKILGWVPGLPKLKKLPLLAQGGTVPARPGVFNKPTAIVGEGRSQWPEFVIPTDPRYRARALSLWESAGGQLMADGGIIGDIIGGVKNVGSKVGGFFSSAAGFLKNPGKALDNLMAGLLKPLKAIKDTAWGQLALGLPKAMLKGLKDLVTGGGDAIAGVGPSPGSGVTRWTGVVRQALGLVGQPLSYTGITLRRMNQESGGNPTIVNKWDSNWLAGHPSVGLMQVIGPTFRAYAGRFRNQGPFSYGVSVDPLANVYASMRYALSRYGNLPSAYNRPGGYDAGGWLGPGQVGMNNLRQPEAVLTPTQWQTMTSLAAAGADGPVVVEIHTQDQALADFIDVRVHRNNQELMTVINAS